jgi:hypothetical protein
MSTWSSSIPLYTQPLEYPYNNINKDPVLPCISQGTQSALIPHLTHSDAWIKKIIPNTIEKICNSHCRQAIWTRFNCCTQTVKSLSFDLDLQIQISVFLWVLNSVIVRMRFRLFKHSWLKMTLLMIYLQLAHGIYSRANMQPFLTVSWSESIFMKHC